LAYNFVTLVFRFSAFAHLRAGELLFVNFYEIGCNFTKNINRYEKFNVVKFLFIL